MSFRTVLADNADDMSMLSISCCCRLYCRSLMLPVRQAALHVQREAACARWHAEPCLVEAALSNRQSCPRRMAGFQTCSVPKLAMRLRLAGVSAVACHAHVAATPCASSALMVRGPLRGGPGGQNGRLDAALGLAQWPADHAGARVPGLGAHAGGRNRAAVALRRPVLQPGAPQEPGGRPLCAHFSFLCVSFTLRTS